MIRIYFDWNVMSQMKNGQQSLLKEILDNNNNLMIFYSTAHIGDILSSYSESQEQKEIINSDLEYISKITENNCLSISQEASLTIDKTDPKILFNQRVDNNASSYDLESVKKIFQDIQDEFKDSKDISMYGSLGINYISMLQQEPLGDEFNASLSDPDAAKAIESVLPGLVNNPTMGGAIESFGLLLDRMNNDTAYESLRSMFQEALQVNKNKSFNWENPFKEYTKVIQKRLNNDSLSVEELLNKSKSQYMPEWYLKIINMYVGLDMIGYKQDKIEVKNGKKKTFKNTTEDAFHAAFSSTCDMYVLNDNKSYLKTKEVFEQLQINTLVLKSDEFVKYYKDIFSYEQGHFTFYLISEVLKNGKPHVYQSGEDVVSEFYTATFLFDYFNIINLIAYEGKASNCDIILRRDKPTNGKYVFLSELNSLTNRLSSYFGPELNNNESITLEEFNNYDLFQNRKWNTGDFNLVLKCLNGYPQLQLDFPIPLQSNV